jgi:hypothetical protein
VCGKHHDLIDDMKNVAKYPIALLASHKNDHERRFKTAERQLIELYADTTQATQPTYPVNLKALAQALDIDEIANHPDEIDGINEFIDKLKECPLEQRGFALKVSERMRRNKKDRLSVDDVMGAFGINHKILGVNMTILEEHNLGSIDEGDYTGRYDVRIRSRNPDSNPFIEIIEFCEATGRSTDELIYDVNFALYDA